MISGAIKFDLLLQIDVPVHLFKLTLVVMTLQPQLGKNSSWDDAHACEIKTEPVHRQNTEEPPKFGYINAWS